ncbi:MAG: MlaD family protein [Lentimicrobiaceae bacterium]|nr:MlaD family protein [Lentimicrobiaceae bacterium]
MKKEKKVIIAVTFIIALVVFIWGVNFLKGNELFSKERFFYAVYAEVNGLEKANPVVINGMKVGKVRDLYFSPELDGTIIAIISLKGDIPIPRNSVARIFSSDLLGSKAINIVRGNSSELAQKGDTLFTSIESGLMEEVNAQILPIKNKAESLLSSVDSIVVVLRAILNENSTQNIKNSLQSLSYTLRNLEHTTGNLDELVQEERYRLTQILENIESITGNFKDSNEHLTTILQNFSSVSDTLAQADIAGVIRLVQSSFENIDAILKEVEAGRGTAGMLVKSDSLYIEVEKTIEALKILLEDVKANPKRYVKFSVF